VTHPQFDASALLDALDERPDLDVVREMVAFLYRALIDAEATEVIGAERFERSVERTRPEAQLRRATRVRRFRRHHELRGKGSTGWWVFRLGQSRMSGMSPQGHSWRIETLDGHCHSDQEVKVTSDLQLSPFW
jgi:hypothetical protein